MWVGDDVIVGVDWGVRRRERVDEKGARGLRVGMALSWALVGV